MFGGSAVPATMSEIFWRAVCRKATGSGSSEETRSLTACGSPISPLGPHEVKRHESLRSGMADGRKFG